MRLFSTIFIKTPRSHAHIWSKNVISVKTTLFHGHKSQQDALFVPLFHEKITALMPIFLSKIRLFSKNTTISYPYQSKKRPFSQKHGALMCFFFKFFMKNSCCRAHDWSKTSILSKQHSILGQKSKQDALFFLFLTKKKITALMSIICQKTFIL